MSAEKLQHFVNVLADDPFEGRETGSRGGRAAGNYLEEQVEKLHLEPAGPDGHYFQDFGAGSRNLLARFEGSDPVLKRQYVVVSAHYDHVGYGKKTNSYGPIGYIHHGADDNASGVSGLLCLAAALERLPEHPRRSLLLAFWDGEEAGLLGSRYWIAHPTLPLDQVPIVVNMDMIGRLRQQRLEIYGTRTASGLRRSLSEQTAGLKVLLDFHWEVKPDSDHFPFIDHGIPALLLCTGLHADYHRPSDTADKINSAGMREVAQFAMRTVLAFANADTLPGFRPRWHDEGVAAKAALEQSAPAPKARLGIVLDDATAPDSAAVAEQALLVGKVVPDSPAAKAGLQAGDRIVKFAGRAPASKAEFRGLVLAAVNPVPIVVERAGSDAPLKLSVLLLGEPVRVGISWQPDEAEPRSVVVVGIVPDSPAERAGMKVADRIYRISGHDFSSSDEFQQLLTDEPNPLKLTVENKGRIRTVELVRADDKPRILEEASKPRRLRLAVPTPTEP
ncbi:MAG TPA: M28 family peptidase [Pirellulales bacterium]|nr:M28 family peptidase [Pirellulales bacterium]